MIYDMNDLWGVQQTATFSAISGADMLAVISVPALQADGKSGRYVFGELMTVTYSVHREVVPVRSLGFPSPRGYVRGPRTIGGSLVFAVIDLPVLNNVRDDLLEYYRKVAQSYGWTQPGPLPPNLLGRLLADEMPPFDIYITAFTDRLDSMSAILIHGVQIVNEGQVMSIEDVMTERTMQYVALDVRPDVSPFTAQHPTTAARS